jgi:hypothetical protein
MSRVRIVTATAVAVSLAFASVALAAGSKVTGGSTNVTASSGAVTLLTNNHITVTPLAPATASGATFTFPITGGKLNTKTLRGVIRHGGGLALSNGVKKITLRRPTIVSTKHGVVLDALVRGRSQRVCHRSGNHHFTKHCVIIIRVVTARIARVTGLSVNNGTATGTVNITAFTASAINRLAGKHVASAGAVLGTASTTPTLG